ncbi:MAG: hypothetical protein V3Q69_10825 [Burkholderia sp.]
MRVNVNGSRAIYATKPIGTGKFDSLGRLEINAFWSGQGVVA